VVAEKTIHVEDLDASQQAFLVVQGSVQGRIGAATQKGREGQNVIDGFTFSVGPSSGGAPRAKQLAVKRVPDVATPQFLQALVSEEPLTDVHLDVCTQNALGVDVCSTRAQLQNARLSSMSVGAAQELLAFDYDTVNVGTLSGRSESYLVDDRASGARELATVEMATPAIGGDTTYMVLSVPGVIGAVTRKGFEGTISVKGAAFKAVKPLGDKPQFSNFEIDTAEPHASFLDGILGLREPKNITLKICTIANPVTGVQQCGYVYQLLGAVFQSYDMTSSRETLKTSFTGINASYGGNTFTFP
jgi:type VI protein secretion system component Hcp